jgi:hypothetical protein
MVRPNAHVSGDLALDHCASSVLDRSAPTDARITIKSRHRPRLPHGAATRRHDVETTNTARRFAAAFPSGGRRRLGS